MTAAGSACISSAKRNTMTQGQQQSEPGKHPSISEHPEQRRQEETGHEDASEPSEVGRPPSQGKGPKESEHAA